VPLGPFQQVALGRFTCALDAVESDRKALVGRVAAMTERSCGRPLSDAACDGGDDARVRLISGLPGCVEAERDGHHLPREMKWLGTTMNPG
jgi:hypothetical protein